MRIEPIPRPYEIARDILIEINQGIIDTPAESPNTKISVLIPPRIDDQLCDICWQIQTAQPDQSPQTTQVAPGNESSIERILDTNWQLGYSKRMEKCLQFLHELDPPYSPELKQQCNFPPLITAVTSKYQRATLNTSNEIETNPTKKQLAINIHWGLLSRTFPYSLFGPNNQDLTPEEIFQLQSRLSVIGNKANFHTPHLPPFYDRQSFQTFASNPDSLNHHIELLNNPQVSISHHPTNQETKTYTRIILTSESDHKPLTLRHRK